MVRGIADERGKGTDPESNLGHTFIDILKADIEGSEFDALTAFLDANADKDVLPVGQIQVELHSYGDLGLFAYFNHWWTALEAAGLRPFWTEPNMVVINLSRGSRPEVTEVGIELPWRCVANSLLLHSTRL
jgi:Methyltransferase FkbM domain